MTPGLATTFLLGLVMATGTLHPTNLKCERQPNPLGTDVTLPRLSWNLESGARGARQTAYQILAADSEANLKADKGNVWDSGKVTSDESIHIVYRGPGLRSRQRVWWKVRVWDKEEKPSAFSKPAFWEMGLLTRADWKAGWIGLPVPTAKEDIADLKWIWFPEGSPRDNAPAGERLFRLTFEVPAGKGKGITGASLLAAADNRFVAYLNGQKMGEGDSWQSFSRLSLGKNITSGKNVLAIAAQNADGPAGLTALLQITHADGTTQRFVSGADWKASDKPGSRWTAGDYDDSGWKNAAVIANLGDSPWGKPNTSGPSSPAAHFRKAFTLPKLIQKARVYASAKGLYTLFLNGQRVGNDIFTPGWTDYKRRVQYQTYDVTKLVNAGENALGIVLGDGWYCGYVGLTGRQNYGTSPSALAQLEVTYTDGTTQTIATDATWKAATGPILSSDLLMGETYDARKEMSGWNAPGFDDSQWKLASSERGSLIPVKNSHAEILNGIPSLEDLSFASMSRPPIYRLAAQYGPPVRKFTELRPKTLTKRGEAVVFDLGQNMVGWARLKVKGPTGTTVRLRFAEILNPDGSIYTTNLRGAKATDYYTLKGQGVEVFEPSFTFHGFRYVEVTGYPGTPTKDAITGIVVTSDTPVSGTFECSNPMVNQLQHNIVWGQMGNYLEVPTDCPQRDERLGWMGDAQVFIRTACYNRDVSGFMTKWIQDIRDAQSPAGGFADVVPRIGVMNDGSPAWGDAGVIVPWTVYLYYGDTRLLEAHYGAMARWNRSIHEANPNLLWVNRSGNNYGDWLNIGADMPRDILATAYFAYSTRLLAKSAGVLGKTEDAQKYERLFQRIREAFNRAYVRSDGRILDKNDKGDTQTCYTLALWFDLLPPDKRALAIQRLVTDIRDKRNGHLSTGFVGVGYLAPTLTAVGYNDLAYRLLNNDTFPSWGYSIKQGATTIWERWDGWTKDKGFQDPGMNSFNHYSLGSVGEWLYHTVAGIDLDPDQPGFKRFVLRPRPGGGLTYARAAYDSIQGRIVSDWKIEKGKFRWKVTIPANTTATVYVPASEASRVREGEVSAFQAAGVRYLRMEDGFAVYEVGSGNYVFRASPD